MACQENSCWEWREVAGLKIYLGSRVIRLTNRLDVRYYVSEELKHNAQISCLSHWVYGGSIHTDGGEGIRNNFKREKNGFPFRNVKFEIPVRHSNGGVNWAAGCINLESKRGVLGWRY